MPRKSKLNEVQIAFALRQAEAGVPSGELCRKYGISQQTFYACRKKYGTLVPAELRKLKQLEAENPNLKKLVADLSLDKHMLQDMLSNKL